MMRSKIVHAGNLRLALASLIFIFYSTAIIAQTGEQCVATVLNRSVTLRPDGSFFIPNVPVQPGYYRIRVSCVANGVTTLGQSDYFLLSANGITDPGPIQYGAQSPLPIAMSIRSLKSTLTTKGESSQLMAHVSYANGSTADVNLPAQGIFWVSSNPDIASVDSNGLVTAKARGAVSITALNEGVQASAALTIAIPNDADNDEMTDDWEAANGFDPNSAGDAGQDFDGDTLSNLQEFRRGTNPRSPDSDGDSLLDGDEVIRGTNPLVADSDRDGLSDGQEVLRGSNPLTGDTDADGIADGLEVQLGLSLTTANPTTTVEGRVVDTDGAPVNNAAITIFSILTANTDVSGFFSMPGVPAGLGPITALAQTVRLGQVLDGASLAIGAVAGGVTDVGTIQIGLNAGTIAGLITDPAGTPVSGALVTVTGANDTRTVNADSSGRYRVANMTAGSLVVTARDYRTGLRGRMVATLPINSSTTVNVQLGPFGTVNGTVLATDNVTPVGAGVAVQFQGPNSQNAVTDPLGQYSFDFTPLGGYNLDATDGSGNRGRSGGNVSVTSQVNVNDIGFLGRGTVTGVVRDGANNPVTGATITLSSSSVFGGQFSATSGSGGVYTIPNVFIGSFSVLGRSGQFAGRVNGTVLEHAQTVTVNVSLAGAGSIAGTVFRPDGTTPIAGVQVSLAGTGLSMETDGSGRFQFDALPLTGYSLDAFDPATGDRGRTTTSINSQGEVATGNITLNGLGSVVVTVRDGPDNLVTGARVRLVGGTVFGGVHSGLTGSDGSVTFNGVFAGPYTVSATDPATGFGGFGSGSVGVGGTASTLVRLQSYGSILGRVFQPNGTDPAVGISVRLSGQVSRSVITGSDGSFRFDVIPVNSYSLDAFDSVGIRARAGVSLVTQGQQATQNLTLIGLGSVEGVVLTEDGDPAPNIGVSLASSAGVFGRSRFTRTDINGRYAISGVPVGAFNLSANAQIGPQQCFGAAQGSISADGQLVNVVLELDCNLIPSTTTLYDANNFAYNIRENASIQDGSPGGMFAGDFGSNRGGFLLDVIVDGTAHRFAGQGFATSEENGRELGITENNLGGINVTRKVYVPRDGYFARYLEILSNPSGSPITASVRITSNFRFISKVQNGFTNNREPRVISTTSGDAQLDISGISPRDHWLVVDDDEDGDPFLSGANMPSVAVIFEGPGAVSPANTADYTIFFGNNYGRLMQEWADVVIPPGGSVAFMHFASEQTGREAAMATAQRLVQLPPEALIGLSLGEMGLVQNFDIPDNGLSSLQSLPQLTGSITGRTLAGDGTTPIGNANVRFKSSNVLFGRTYTQPANSTGNFSVNGVITGNGNSLAVPADEFTLIGIHPLTGIPSEVHTGSFTSGLLNATKDVIFNTAGNLTGTVRRHHGAVVSSGTVVVSGGSLQGSVTLAIAANGSFKLDGLPAGSYTLVATAPVAQGSDLLATVTPTIIAGQTTAAEIVMPQTGTIAGTLRRGSGAPVVNLALSLRGANSLNRITTTDTGGRFTFIDVPTGTTSLDAYDAFSNTAAHADPVVVVDQTTTVNLVLTPGAIVEGLVTLPSGVAVPNAQITLTTTGGQLTTSTGSDGRYRVAGVALGNVSVFVNDPASLLRGTAAGNLPTSGETLTLNVTLYASGTVVGTVFRTDGVTPIPGATVQISGSTLRNTTTDSNGNYTFQLVPLGSYTIQGTAPVSLEKASVSGVLSANLENRRTDIIVQPNIIISDASVTERNVGTSSASFTVRLSSASLLEVRVDYSLGGGNALPSIDYQPATGTVIFPPGVVERPISVLVVGDVSIEPDETFAVSLSNASNGTISDPTGIGTILNDDGRAGEIDHFSIAAISSPQYVNEPFAVTINALDANGTVVTGFQGPVTLNAQNQGPDVSIGNGNVSWNWPFSTYYHDARLQSIYLASEIGAARTITALGLDVVSRPNQTMNNFTIRVKHTAMTEYGGSPQWESSGWTTVYQQAVNVPETGPLILQLSTPFNYNGTDNLLVDFSFNNNFYTSDGTTRSTSTTQNRSIYFRTDSGFGDPLNWSGTSSPNPGVSQLIPNLRLIGSQSSAILDPATSGTFVNGVWTGVVSVDRVAANLTLRADDGDGHSGWSEPFSIVQQDDVSIAISDAPDPAPVGSPLTYTMTVANSGPPTAGGVTVTDVLAPGLTFVSATSTQGACTFDSGTRTVRCDLGDLVGGGSVNIAVVVVPTLAGSIANTANVSRAGVDADTTNNSATAMTTVLQPGISINDVSLTEGNVGTQSATFTLTLTYPSSQSITVNYATASGTAWAASDFAGASGVVTFAPGQTSRTVPITIFSDVAIEASETFNVNLSAANGATLLRTSGVGTILNDDGIPGEIYSFAWDTIGSPQFVNEPFTVTVRAMDAFNNLATSYNGVAALRGFGTSAAESQGNTLLGNFATPFSFGGTFTMGYSFTPNEPITVTHFRHITGTKVSLWTDTGTLVVSQNVNSVPGVWTETQLSNPVHLQAGTRYRIAFYQANGTMHYGTPVPTSFPNGAIHQVYYTGADAFPNSTDSVLYAVDMRYTLGTSSTVSLTPTQTGNFINGVWTGSITVNGTADQTRLRADDGNGHVSYSNPFLSALRNDLILHMTDSPDPIAVGETLTYTLTLANTGPLAANNISIQDVLPTGVAFVSANLPGGISTHANGTVTMTLDELAGGAQVVGTIVVVPTRGGLLANRATVSRAGTDPFAGNNTASVSTTIIPPTISINDITVTEGNSGQVAAVFTITLSAPSSLTVGLSYSTQDIGTSSGDLVHVSNQQLQFQPGETSKQITINVNGDTLYEVDEQFRVNLSGLVNATFVDSQGVATIVNDDARPTVSIADAQIMEGDIGTRVLNFTVTQSAASGLNTSFSYSTQNGTATAVTDYAAVTSSASISAGQTSQTIAVTILGDVTVEPDETFTITLSNLSNADVGDGTATGTILDDDGVERQLHHFTWTPIASPQGVGEPFAIEVTAKDAFENTVTTFNGSVSLEAGVPDLTSGLNLLAYWDFNQVGSGIATDRVAGIAGTLVNGAAYTPDLGGWTGLAGDRAMDFGRNSAGQSVVVNNAAFLNSAASRDQMTVVFRQRLVELSNSSSFWLVAPSAGSSSRGFQGHVPWSDNTVYFDTSGCCSSQQRISASMTSFPDYTGNVSWWTTWHHFAFVKDRGVKTVYIDGRQMVQGTGASPLPRDFNQLIIGAQVGSSGNIRGWIDDYAVFGSALTAAEVTQIAGGTAPNQLPERPLTPTFGTRNLLNGVGHQSVASGYFTLGLWFIPNKDISVTAIRHYYGTKGYLWDDSGTVLAVQALNSSPGTWRETPLNSPVQLRSGQRYRIGVVTDGGLWHYRQESIRWSDGTVVGSAWGYGDSLVVNGPSTGTHYMVDFAYRSGSDIDYTPKSLTGFVNGVYTGPVEVRQPVPQLIFVVDDGNGHLGQANVIEVVLRNDLAISAVVAPENPEVGTELTYTLTVRNSGPGESTGVAVVDTLPTGFLLNTHSASQGACTVTDGTVTCELGNLASGASATVTLVGRSQVDGPLANVATVRRTEAEGHLANNSVTSRTRVASFLSFRVGTLTANNPQAVHVGGTAGSESSAVGGLAATSLNLLYTGNSRSVIHPVADLQLGRGVPNRLLGLVSDLASGQAYQLGSGGLPINGQTMQLTDLLPVIEESGAPNSGDVLRELWSGFAASPADILTDQQPDYSDRQAGLEQNAYASLNSSGGIRLRTLVEAPETGDYTFFISGDNSELYLSTDEQSANRVRIARGTDFTGSREWNNGANQRSAPVNLIAGQRYYLEVLKAYRHNAAVGVGWAKPGQATTTASELIPNSVLHRQSSDLQDEPVIQLSQAITMSAGSGIFAGYGRIVVHNGVRVYDIDLPTGFVTDLGPMVMPSRQTSNSGWFWGIAENDRDTIDLLYVRDSQSIVRTRVPTGATTVHSTFSNLGLNSMISAIPHAGRWAFAGRSASQFLNTAPGLGVADATFSVTPTSVTGNDLSVTIQASANPAIVEQEISVVITVANSGPDPATSVRVTDLVSGGASIRAATASQGTASVENGSIHAELGSIPGGQSATLTVTFAKSQPGAVIHSVNVSRGETDLYPPNNTAVCAIPVIAPSVRISDVTLSEGEAGATSEARFEVTLSNPLTLPVQVNYGTANGTAFAGSDYNFVSATVTFEPGQTQKTVAVEVRGDSLYELDETFSVNLTSAINARIADGTGVATIRNDDALPVLTISPVSVNEGNTGTRTLVFVAQLNTPSGLSAQVDYSTADGTAGFPLDYFPVSGRLTFNPGEIQKTVSVVVNGDTEVEPDEVFYLNLSNPVNAELPQVRASGAILDDDGVVGQIHHFEFAPISSPQYAGEPFAVTVTALDYEGGVVTDYTGPLPLVARTPSTQVFNFLGNLPSTTSFNGNYTVGFSFTPATDITVTHFRHYFGTKASIWTDSGSLLVSQPLFGAPGAWNETLLSTPVVLRAGTRYRYGVYSGNGTLHYVNLNLPQSQHAVLHGEYESSGDNFIGNGPYSGFYYLVDLGFEVGSIALTPVSPTALTGFSGGVWSGNVTVLEPVENTVLQVNDGDGHEGVAEAIQVGLRNDLALSLSTSNEHPELGDLVTWTSTVRCLGPTSSSGVVVRQTLPYGILFVSGTTSNGSGCTADGSNVTCEIGAMADGDEVTVEIVVEVHADGRMTSTSTVSRTESEAYTRNNSANVPMNVMGGDYFRIISLGATGALSIEHNSVTGDDRGGIAVSDTHVFYTGDNSTGRFGLEDLSGAVSTGSRYDALCSDLRSSLVYHFANGGGFVGQGGFADSLIQLDGTTGSPTGVTIPLSQSINLSPSSGIFSGYGRVLVWVYQSGSLGRVYDIQLPSGLVTDLGQTTIPVRQFAESWAFWGVAENVNGVFNLVYVRNYESIVRTRVSDSFTEEVARFSNLSDMASFTVKPDRNRWYFHHEGQSEFRDGNETIGFADATFETRHHVVSDDVSVEVTATSETIDPGSDAPFTITVRNSGPSMATGVQLEATIAGPATLTSASSSEGAITINGNTVFVAIGDLAADAAVTVELVGLTEADGDGVVTCQATVTRSEVDFYYNNNTSSATSVVASPVLVSVSDVEVFEGSDGLGEYYTSVDVTVTLSREATSEVTVNFQTVDGTAYAFSDYIPNDGQVVFSPGETVKTITTFVYQDLEPENEEFYEIVLSDPSNAQLDQSAAMVTIFDDDSGGESPLQLRQLAGVSATERPVLLSITCVEMPTETSSATLRLSFDSVANVRYVVEATSSVGGKWEEVLAIPGTGKRLEILEKSGNSETRIYRLRTERIRR